MILDAVRRLRAAVDLDPKNWNLRLVLADALEEAGQDVLAYGQRYQAKKKRCPRYRKRNKNGSDKPYDEWEWWSIVDDDLDWLPQELFDKLDNYNDIGPMWCHIDRIAWKSYKSAAAADASFARALWT